MKVRRDAHDPPTHRIPGPPPPGPQGPGAPPPGAQDYPPEPPAGEPVTAAIPTPAKPKRSRVGLLRDPLSIFLIFVTVLALVVAGLIGTELYARHIADNKVSKATECETEDAATVSFGVSPPFLWQHITGHYTNISIETAGNRIKDAQEMKAQLNIVDVRLGGDGDSGGSIGALDATITWPADGIKKTIQDMVPGLGKLVSNVTTHSDDGTVELESALGGVTVEPTVENNALTLHVVKMSGLAGMFGALTKDNIQPTLDTFTEELTGKYPLGIHPDSVEVTDDGVVAKFSTRNATIPSHSQNPCFANL